MSVFMLSQQMDSCACNCVFSKPMWLSCSCCSALSCSAVGIIIPLPSITKQSMIAVSSLNDQHGYSSVPHPWSIAIQGIRVLAAWLCAHHLVFLFLFLLLLCSLVCLCMSLMHRWQCTCLEFVYLLFVSWLCLDSQSVMNSCGPCLCSILMLYWCIHNSIPWSLCDRLATSFLKIAISSLWSVIMLTPWVKKW